jgi:hypothetical protein
MSGDVERVAAAVRDVLAACTCTPYPAGEGPEIDCPMHGRADYQGQAVAQALLAPGGVVAEHGEYLYDLGVHHGTESGYQAGAAEVRTRVEAVLPECWTFAGAESCRSMIGGTFPNGTKWTADMCCLPCQLRAALADPDTAAPATEPATRAPSGVGPVSVDPGDELGPENGAQEICGRCFIERSANGTCGCEGGEA